ncbi:MAG TPA: ATP-dependent Clp protease proteolytic subunit [Acidimicrobiia bacterium]|jgi:ClpP class serine protease
MTPIDLLWLFFLLASLQPAVTQRLLTLQRARAMRAMERRDRSRVITMIHRRESFSFLGIPFGGFIDIEDSEAVIRAIETTNQAVPIDFVIHTPGGLVLAAEQIAAALARHPAPVRVYVPHYAMSGGTLLALAADRIVMSPSAVLGPVDPQIGEFPAASLLCVVDKKDINKVDDRTLVLADVGHKAQKQIQDFVEKLLARHQSEERAREVANALTEGRWTHDFPIDLAQARSLGLPVSDDLPDEVRELLGLYPQPRGRRPSVEYLPTPYEPPQRPSLPTRRSERRAG